jgi:hypothetical protein
VARSTRSKLRPAAYNRRMAARRISEPFEPMTLGDMRANGVHSLAVSCWHCHHEAVISAAPRPDDMPVPMFGPRMVCARCGIVGADVRPNWRERPARESLTGVRRRSRRRSIEWAGQSG